MGPFIFCHFHSTKASPGHASGVADDGGEEDEEDEEDEDEEDEEEDEDKSYDYYGKKNDRMLEVVSFSKQIQKDQLGNFT